MKKLMALTAGGLVLLNLVACGGAGSPVPVTPGAPSASAAPSPRVTAPPITQAPTVTPAPTAGCDSATVGEVDPADVVPGQANIFGAGHDIGPNPGGDGRGVLPPVRILPAGATRIVTFPEVTGCVQPIAGETPYNGPGGDLVGRTDIASWDGIAGIVHEQNGMFLVGVFLSDAEPADPAPERLEFTGGEDFEVLAPGLAQVFFIGDGIGRRFEAPAGATRLFLGFADAAGYIGLPGWYGNNRGELKVVVAVEAL